MLSVRATAERAVDVAREDALNTARREIERKFNERAAGLQDKLVDVAINLDQEGSMAIAGIFATKLCVKCGHPAQFAMSVMCILCYVLQSLTRVLQMFDHLLDIFS